MLRILNLHFCLQNLIYTLHRCQPLRNAVACLRKLFQGIDDGVEHYEVVDKRRSTNHGILAQYQRAAKPQYDDNHHRSQELTHRMSQLLTDVHPHDVVTISGIHTVETGIHLLLRRESLDDTQTAQRLFHLTHRVAPQGLRLHTVLLQLPAHKSHEPAEQGHKDQSKHRQLPRYDHQRNEVGDDQHGILKQHIQRRHDTVFYLLHITAHSGNDVTFALFREKA